MPSAFVPQSSVPTGTPRTLPRVAWLDDAPEVQAAWQAALAWLRDHPEDTAPLGGAYGIGVHYYRAESEVGDHLWGPSVALMRVFIEGELVFEAEGDLRATHAFWEPAAIEWGPGPDDRRVRAVRHERAGDALADARAAARHEGDLAGEDVVLEHAHGPNCTLCRACTRSTSSSSEPAR